MEVKEDTDKSDFTNELRPLKLKLAWAFRVG
jgi:hypothetical protein